MQKLIKFVLIVLLKDNNEGKLHAIKLNLRLFNQNVAKLNYKHFKWHAMETRTQMHVFIRKNVTALYTKP